MALDGEKRQLDAIGSNAGQCLWTGIASPARARDVADRLMGPAMFSRLGDPDVRRRTSPATTRSATTRARSGRTTRRSIAAGLKRYGFDDESNRLVGHVFEAAQHFAGRSACRSCSAASTATSRRMPVPYPVACSPQAWAAGASFLFLETMLGLRAHADRRRAGAAPPEPARLARQVHASRTSGSATRRSTCCSTAGAGRRRAEVLRKVGDVSVTIRL